MKFYNLIYLKVNTLANAQQKNQRFECEDDLTEIRFVARLLFKTQTIANFLVEDGKQITYEPLPQMDQWRFCNLLFGGVIGALLIQREIFALHGCSIETSGGVVVICGDSGAGKSTLTGLLMQRGFRILDDNIAALFPWENSFQVQPGLGFLKLTPDTLNLLGLEANGPGFIFYNSPKFLHFLSPTQFCDHPQRLRQICVLNRRCPQFLSPVNGLDKIKLLQRYTYMNRMLSGLGKQDHHFRQALKIAQANPLSILGYPPEDNLQSWGDRLTDWLQTSRRNPP